MSLMTESLRRLAEARGGLGPAAPSTAPSPTARRDDPPSPAPPPTSPPPAAQPADEPLHAVASAPPAEPPHAESDRPPAIPEPVPQTEPRRVRVRESSQVNEESHDPVEPKANAAQIPPAVAKLRNAILQDIGKSAGRDTGGKIVVVAGIQAETDAMAAVASLGRAFAGIGGGEVLVMDASSPPPGGSEELPADDHGLTSLIDGTRKLQDVLAPTPMPGMSFVRRGLAKGTAQVVDQKAVRLMMQDCRAAFAYTIINGGDWQTKQLPLIARLADAFYVVVRSNATDRETAKSAVKFFDGAGVHVRGCILAGPDGRPRRQP